MIKKLESPAKRTPVPKVRIAEKLSNFAQADILFIWLFMTLINLSYHHLIPLDETRYAAVAWEMWRTQDFLVPHLNGAPYHHKPPLLFWLYALGWSIFGINELWLLLVSPLCGLISLYLLRHLAWQLWPDNPTPGRLAPWFLFGSLLWGAFLNSAMFDTLLTASVLVAMCGLVKAARDLRWKSWALFSLGCGLGLLAKGPVVFVHTLIPFLTGFAWSDKTVKHDLKRWYLQGSAAIACAVVLALCWAVPAILSAGEDYGLTLLWHQTVDRISNSFAHKRPVWWYLMLSPILLFPWFFWPRAWRHLFQKALLKEGPFRFCLIWFASGFIGFSLISGKQVHYLIPLLPALALLLSRALPEASISISLGDYFPFLAIIIFALLLLILPQIQDIKLYHWLQARNLWWPILLLLIGLAAIVNIYKTGSASPYLLSMTVIVALTASIAGFFRSTGNAFHLQQAAQVLEGYRKMGEPIAWAEKYDGQFQFLLRLTKPMEVIELSSIDNWLGSHRNGHVVWIEQKKKPDRFSRCNDYKQFYREDYLCIGHLPQ